MGKQSTECDWIEIKRRVIEGHSYRSIAKDHPITHVSIMNRCKSEGWLNGKAGNQAIAMLESKREVTQPNSFKTPEIIAEILNNIRQGMSPTTAAAQAGISPSTLTKYRKDVMIDDAVKEARLASLGDAETSIYEAHERGDWKAGLERIRRSKELREEWQENEHSGGGLTVVVNVDRNDTVDITPK